ncbi:MAG: hypothetical protein OXU51_20875 [Candidatus Poribacteria bacterium]|nr:hypothetical protein [Candidatus Poribacteria bacterium]
MAGNKLRTTTLPFVWCAIIIATTPVSGFNTVGGITLRTATFLLTILAAGVRAALVLALGSFLAIATIRFFIRYAATVSYCRIGKLGYLRATTTAGRFCCGRIRATTAGHLCFAFYDKAVIRTRKDKSCSEK